MLKQLFSQQGLAIGVGLRHAHFKDILERRAPLDFVEVHSENFFGEGSQARRILLEVAKEYPVSLHSTSMGLGSEIAIHDEYLKSLKKLSDDIKPFLLSDHAAFAWGEWNEIELHAGDLLPVAFNKKNLDLMTTNVDRCQEILGRPLLIENLSAYITPPGSEMSETEFLTLLSQHTGCSLLVDLNNLMVNAHNFGFKDSKSYAVAWLDAIPGDSVGELHLAGYSSARPGEIAVDDHAQPVSDDVWSLYSYALEKFGPTPTLIEWDNNLPPWETLLAEAAKARSIADEVLFNVK